MASNRHYNNNYLPSNQSSEDLLGGVREIVQIKPHNNITFTTSWAEIIAQFQKYITNLNKFVNTSTFKVFYNLKPKTII